MVAEGRGRGRGCLVAPGQVVNQQEANNNAPEFDQGHPTVTLTVEENTQSGQDIGDAQ